MNFPRVALDFSQLHHEVAAGRRVTIVTPNRRLAVYLKGQYDSAQRDAGRLAWDAADILPLQAYIERMWRALAMRQPAPVPQLLSAMQCQFAWEEVVRASEDRAGLLSVPQAARQALAAWQLAHAWQLLSPLRHFAVHEDVRIFISWMQKYQAACREKNWIDSVSSPDAVAGMLADISTSVPSVLPEQLFIAGFDLVTPQQLNFFSACASAGVNVQVATPGNAVADATVRRIEFADEDDELRRCAAWARHRVIAAPGSRVAIVVPDLAGKRSAISRALMDALLPQDRAQVDNNGERGARLFNISLGRPLSDYGLVNDALALIEFSLNRPLPFPQVSALLRSPYIAHADSESAARAALDAALREMAAPEINLFSLQKKLKVVSRNDMATAVGRCEVFCERVDRVADLPAPLSSAPRSPSQKGAARTPSPQDWARHFGRILATWGFPGETSLGSSEHQVLAKFRDALASLGTLQAMQPRMNAGQALAQLRRVLADTVFQPESVGEDNAPIQVLGILESAGQHFDALWVTGLSNDAWPIAARPNPFIPAVLQRNAGVTESSAAASLALDRRITEGWAGSASEVIFSHAVAASGHAAGEQPREASALIAHVSCVNADDFLGAIVEADFAAALQTLGTREPVPDEAFETLQGPVSVRGGAGVIRDQAACPFRAFARHRLSARSLEEPHTGLDAAERGTLLHRALSLVWEQLRSHATLVALDETQLAEVVQQSVLRAMADARADGVDTLTGRFAAVEETRLCRLIGEWLVYERERAPFEVIEREQRHSVVMGGLAMHLQLDRMDRLADGTHALIDYKTGVARIVSWLGARPDEPQLPLYFVTAEQPVSTVAFARVKRGERGRVSGFEGVSAAENLLPDVAPIEQKYGMEKKGYLSWDVLVQEWESSLNVLAHDFSAGEARVDPKNGGLTCQHCDLQSICRIAEVAGYATQDNGTETGVTYADETGEGDDDE
ncbi:MAG: PD-(D/E)XK nuclease family protein [Betaproteobacteria bacterium]